MSVKDSITKLSSEYFTDISEDVNTIYVDMEILQDFRVGALLQTATVQEEIEYIQYMLPKYNGRLDMETVKYFPDLKHTDEELLEIIKKNPVKTALISPWTKIYNNFHIVLKYLYMQNRNKNVQTTPITIVVNSSDMLYPLPIFDKFAKQIKSTYPGAIIKVAAYPRYQAPDDLYLNTDMFFLYDHEKFFSGSFIREMMNSAEYKPRTIYTTPYINPKTGLDPSEYMKGLTSTGATLNLFFDFFYMPNGVLYEKETK